MSKTKKLKATISNSLFARRDSGSPDNEETNLVTTLEDIARQVKLEAAESLFTSDQNDFFAQTHALTGRTSTTATPSTRTVAVEGQKKDKPVRRAKLTADRYEELIENDLTVLDIISQIIDRNTAIGTQLKNSNPTW